MTVGGVFYRFARKRLHLQLQNIQTGEVNTEYLFSRK